MPADETATGHHWAAIETGTPRRAAWKGHQTVGWASAADARHWLTRPGCTRSCYEAAVEVSRSVCPESAVPVGPPTGFILALRVSVTNRHICIPPPLVQVAATFAQLKKPSIVGVAEPGDREWGLKN